MPGVQESDAFRKSRSELSKTEKKQVEQAIRRIRQGYEGDGFKRHKLRDRVYIYRGNRDLRIIAYHGADIITLLHVDHHDAAYDWVDRRQFSTEPESGVPIVKVEETVMRSTSDGRQSGESDVDALLQSVPIDDAFGILWEDGHSPATYRKAAQLILSKIISANQAILNRDEFRK